MYKALKTWPSSFFPPHHCPQLHSVSVKRLVVPCTEQVALCSVFLLTHFHLSRIPFSSFSLLTFARKLPWMVQAGGKPSIKLSYCPESASIPTPAILYWNSLFMYGFLQPAYKFFEGWDEKVFTLYPLDPINDQCLAEGNLLRHLKGTWQMESPPYPIATF